MGVEGKVQNAAIKYARGLGLKAKRNVFRPGVEAGWPDVEIFGRQGRLLIIEFKAPGKEPTPLQAERIRELRELGYNVIVCSTFESAKLAIDAVS